MKPLYKKLILVLFIGAIILIVFSYVSLLGCDSQAARLIQILSGLAVAVAAVIALSNADIPKKKVNVTVEKVYIDDERVVKESELDGLKKFYKKFPVTSYRVHLKIKNKSGFDLKNPVLTFAQLPKEKQPPYSQTGKKPYSKRRFTFSVVRTDKKAYSLVVDKKLLISLDGLPYWNKDSEIDVWIRMVLDDGEFDVEVSVNCENADGVTKTVTINPKGLLQTGSETNPT
jgi:hypothetical protein